jgi:Winged helix DNA-binding domain
VGAAASLALPDARALLLRAQAQHLTNGSRVAPRPAVVLREVVGLQSQLLSAAALGLRVRANGLTMRAVTTALTVDRSIARTWLMRGTLHLVASDELRWLLSLLGPASERGSGRRQRELGLDENVMARGIDAIRKILATSGPLTRGEIVERLVRHGIRLDRKSQAPIHLIAAAARRGVCCLGPDTDDGETTYVLLDDWVPPATAPMPGPGELARRYFRAFGPATLADFAAWSGLPAPMARASVLEAAGDLRQVSVQGQAALMATGQALTAATEARGSVRLLPAFDTYLLGYKRRDLAVPASLERRLQRGGGWLHPAVLVDGRAVGAWSLRKTGKRADVVVDSVREARPIPRPALEQEVRDVARFLGLEVGLKLNSPPVKRTS